MRDPPAESPAPSPPPKPPSAFPDGAQPGVLPKFLCEEPQHTTGNDVRQCRTCAKPVCMTCIVKDSFLKFNENIFQSRRRILCKPCWDSSKFPAERKTSQDLRQVASGQKDADIFSFASATPNKVRNVAMHKRCFCQCRSHNGTLCLACKKQHMAEAQLTEAHCTQPACAVLITLENHGGSRCRWCGLPCGPATRIERREIFRMRRKSTIEHMAAVAGVENLTVDSAEELTYGNLCQMQGSTSIKFATPAVQQQLCKRPSDEQTVQRSFGENSAAEEGPWNQARWRLREVDMDPFWRHRQGSFYGIHPMDVRWLNHDKSVRKSKPLIGEGEVPKSLALFQPLHIDEQRLRAERGGVEIASVPENEEGEEDTLYDGDSDAGTLKDGKMGGKGKAIAEKSDDDDDATTITSIGSTLYEEAETNTDSAEQNAVSSPPPGYSSVVPTEADRDWALFCAKGF